MFTGLFAGAFLLRVDRWIVASLDRKRPGSRPPKRFRSRLATDSLAGPDKRYAAAWSKPRENISEIETVQYNLPASQPRSPSCLNPAATPPLDRRERHDARGCGRRSARPRLRSLVHL